MNNPNKTSNKNTSMASKWMSRIKNHPIVAVLIVTGTVSLSVLQWSNDAIEAAEQLADKLGILETSKQRQVIMSAYRLGKTVAFLSVYERDKSYFLRSTNYQNIVANKKVELEAFSKELEISIDHTRQYFMPPPAPEYTAIMPDFRSAPCFLMLGKDRQEDFGLTFCAINSPAAEFFYGQVRSKYGKKASRSFRLGIEVEGSLRMALENGFSHDIMSGSGAPAIQTIEGLSKEAESLFGVESTDPNSILTSSEKKSVNDSMKFLLESLDSRIEKNS